MAPVIEKEAKRVAVLPDAALQRPTVKARGFTALDDIPRGMDNDPDGAVRTVTLYLQGDFGELPTEIAGHRVVRSLDPAKWPDPVDPGCQKEWDELDACES